MVSNKDNVETYPLDEFDRQARTAPCGVHRRPARRWQALLPVLIIGLIVGPLLAWGAMYLLGNDSSESATSASSQSQSADKKPTVEIKPADDEAKKAQEAEQKKAEEAAKSEQEAKQREEEQAKAEAERQQKDRDQVQQLKTTVQVDVLNTTSVTGKAGAEAKKLTDAGFSKVKADNAQAGELKATVVLYNGDANKLLAEEAARVLGISNVQAASQAGVTINSPVAVYLIN